MKILFNVLLVNYIDFLAHVSSYCLIAHPHLLYILFHDDIDIVVYVCQLCGWFRVHAAYCIIFALYF
jgi:hypothetical protein